MTNIPLLRNKKKNLRIRRTSQKLFLNQRFSIHGIIFFRTNEIQFIDRFIITHIFSSIRFSRDCQDPLSGTTKKYWSGQAILHSQLYPLFRLHFPENFQPATSIIRWTLLNIGEQHVAFIFFFYFFPFFFSFFHICIYIVYIFIYIFFLSFFLDTKAYIPIVCDIRSLNLIEDP